MMQNFKNYRKTGLQFMRPYIPGEVMITISIADCDTPELGGMIAMNPDDHADKWYVSKEFFEENYEPA